MGDEDMRPWVELCFSVGSAGALQQPLVDEVEALYHRDGIPDWDALDRAITAKYTATINWPDGRASRINDAFGFATNARSGAGLLRPVVEALELQAVAALPDRGPRRQRL